AVLVANPSADGADPGRQAGAAQRILDLECLADELADQRCQLAEAWQRVAALHDQWHADRAQAATELEAYGQRLLERDLIVLDREGASVQAEEALRQRHGDMVRLHD